MAYSNHIPNTKNMSNELANKITHGQTSCNTFKKWQALIITFALQDLKDFYVKRHEKSVKLPQESYVSDIG